MRTSSFRSTSPVGIFMTLGAGLLVSLLVLFGRFEAAPRVWGGLAIGCACLALVWQLSRRQLLTLGLIDQFTWAVLISHTVLVARIRDPRALADDQGLTVEIAMEIAIWCVCLFYATGRLLGNLDRLSNLWGPAARYATLFFGAAAISTLYSVSPSITLAWCLKLLTILVVATILFDPRDPSSSTAFVKATYMGLLFMLGQFLVLGALSPSAAASSSDLTGIWRLGGYLLPATQLSAVAGMTVVLGLIDILAGRRDRNTLIILSGAGGLMLLSLGRGGMLAAGLATALTLFLFRKVRLAVVMCVVAGTVFLLTPSALDISWELLSRRQEMSEITSLTGRVPLWWKSIDLILEKPILGWGYVSGSRVALLTQFRYWPASHSHNAFLETLLTLGVIGCSILLLMLWRTIIGAVSLLRQPGTAEHTAIRLALIKSTALVVFLLVEGTLNAGFGGAPRFEATIMIGSVFCIDHLLMTRQSVPGRSEG